MKHQSALVDVRIWTLSGDKLMNAIKIFLTILILNLVNFHSLLPQTSEPDNEEFYYERPYLLITSATGIPGTEDSIEKEVTDIITACVTDLGSFDIIDRNSVAHLFEEASIDTGKFLDDSVLVKIGRLAFANEMMVVKIVSYWQMDLHTGEYEKKVIDESEYLLRAVQRDSLMQENNIQTHLLIQIKILDLDSGQQLETVTIEINHTRGSKEESRAGIIEKLINITIRELKNIYLLSPEVVESKNRVVLLNSGSRAGIQKGMLFLIKSPDHLEEYFDEIITIPGKNIGIVSANEISEENTFSTILRQNGYIKPGYRAFEYPKSIYGLRINFSPAIVDSMMSLGAQFFWQPIQRWSYGLGIRMIRVTDSYGDNDFGFGMEGLGGVHLLSGPRVRVGGIIGLNFDLPFRKDDDNNTVYLPILSGQVGVMVDIFHYWKTDISIFAGYRISSGIKGWQISGEEETDRSVYWENAPPEVNISGFFIQIGYKFIFL